MACSGGGRPAREHDAPAKFRWQGCDLIVAQCEVAELRKVPNLGGEGRQVVVVESELAQKRRKLVQRRWDRGEPIVLQGQLSQADAAFQQRARPE